MKNIEHPTSNIQHPMAMRSGHRSMLDVGCWMFDVPKFLLVFAIRAYRWTISPAQAFLFGPACGCRFMPTCSQYALEAIYSRGVLTGSALTVKRICRCHPWGGCGHDPVPKVEIGNRKPEIGTAPKHSF
jgi:uncharacterized protein